MERSIGSLTNLPVDLLLQQLTYLPFDDVISVCTSNATLHSYCSDPRYNNNWKLMIDNTFSTVYNYEDKLKKIWSKLNISEGTYNYLVYTQLINVLDPLTQLMIYYQQGDIKSFNDNKFTAYQRFLTMFLLNKPEEMKKYDSEFANSPHYLLLQGKNIDINFLNNMLDSMLKYGNLRGVKYMIEKGADIHYYKFALRRASEKGQIDIVRYLVEQGADIHAKNDEAFILASQNGHLDVVKYLIEQGINIHTRNDEALGYASQFGYLDMVKYLVEHGANIHADNDYALKSARYRKHTDVVRYLVEQGGGRIKNIFKRWII